MNKMKISIITVSYNAEKTIEKTMQSVISQSYDNVEYIIIDGASTDRTTDIIRAYDSHIAYWVSESDNGVYDAMNKGIAKATGDYINFMNAGDLFYDSKVLEKVAGQIEKDHADIYYGNSIFFMQGNEMYCNSPADREGVLKAALRKEMLNHQSMFVKSGILKERGFEQAYKIAADLEWLCYSLDQKYTFEKIDETICCYDQTGLSSKASMFPAMNRENDVILEAYSNLQDECGQDIHKANAEYYYDLARRNHFIMYLLNQWLLAVQRGKSLVPYFEKHNYYKVAVYGMGMLGRRLIDELRGSSIQVVYGMDQKADYYTGEFPVYTSPPEAESVDVIVVTAGTYFNEIKCDLEQKLPCDIVSLEDILPKAFEEE